ncbi:MAG: D-alanyl-D-alanine carboxypeptidase/D-alanyl-D-alanine-endopeptidase [Bacteroidales bacterium]
MQKYLLRADTTGVFRSVSWGCIVEKVKDGSTIAGIHSDELLIPASAIKIAVTYPAWKLLKPDFRFATIIEYDGDIHDSVLHGNLYIRGGGDPTLGSDRFPNTSEERIFKEILELLKQKGIKEISGGLISDADFFDDRLIPGGWIWDDIGNYYGCGVSGLNFHENLFSVTFQPGKNPGDPAKLLRIEPAVGDLIIDNEVVTGLPESGDGVIIYGAPYDNHRVLTGTVPAGKTDFTVKGSVPDPALNMINQFYKYLALNNIIVKFHATTNKILRKQGNQPSRSRVILGTLYSPDLIDIIKMTHEKSINMFADALLKMIGKQAAKDGSYNSGIAVVMSFWESMGIDVTNLMLSDGSGLSPLNRVSPSALSHMFRIIARDTESAPFLKSLNLAGETGDLQSMFSSGPCKNRLRGKSGYMKTVRAYAGIVSGESGEDLSYSIIINHSGADSPGIKKEVKKILELFCNCRE